MASTSTTSGPYLSVSTIPLVPGKAKEALAALEEVAKATMDNEPGAKFYRFYKTEGKEEIVCMEKFESREAYASHVQSDHVRAWANKYLGAGLFEGSFEFHHLNNEGIPAGGFDRQ